MPVKKHKKITAELVSLAEREHVGWMSEDKYYSQVWDLILADVNVQRCPSVLVMNHPKRSKSIGLDFIVLSQQNFAKLAKAEFIKFSQRTHEVLIWPIGVLYAKTTNAVHWNVFIYKKNRAIVYRFDPSLSRDHKACYAYSNSVLSSIQKASGHKLYTEIGRAHV